MAALARHIILVEVAEAVGLVVPITAARAGLLIMVPVEMGTAVLSVFFGVQAATSQQPM